MGIVTSHGSRQCSDESPFRAAWPNLYKVRGAGSLIRESTNKLPRRFAIFFVFPPLLFLLCTQEEGSRQN